MEKTKYCHESLTIKTSLVAPPDTNVNGTMFGGKLMAYIDDVAAIAAMRHSRRAVVTASTDSVDFLHPVYKGNSVCLEAFVTYTGTTSMEIFVKCVAENTLTGERHVAAVSFLTFVALDENGRPTPVPKVVPQTEEEKHLHETGKERSEVRKKRRKDSEERARVFGTEFPW